MTVRGPIYAPVENLVNDLGPRPELPLPTSLDYQFQNLSNYNFQDLGDFDFN